MNKPLVSILINNYNYGQFLSDAIDSALNQTYKDIEVIVVDDGSTDISREIISGYGNRIIPLLKENGGQASAFNSGFNKSNGELVCFLDSDDIWYKNKIEAIVNVLKQNAPKNWAYLRHNLLDSRCITANKVSDSDRKYIPNIIKKIDIEYINRLNLLSCRRDAPTTAICAPRWALSRIMPIQESKFRISADAYLYTHLPSHGPVISINDTLGIYRIHGRNAYYSENISEQKIIKIIELEFALLEDLPDDTRYNDLILKLSHLVKYHNPQYLKKLGTLPKRLFRICGSCNPAELKVITIKALLKELIRSLK